MSQSLKEILAGSSGGKEDVSFKVKNKDGALVKYDNLQQLVNTLSPKARAVLMGTSGTRTSDKKTTVRRRRRAQ